MLYDGFVKKLAERFQHKVDSIIAVENFDHGPEFEIALCELLRTILPRRAVVCRGYIVGRDGTMAGDDIIVFDAARFPTLRALGDDLSRKEQVPAEAVLAYIEAKSTIYLQETQKTKGQALVKAIAQTANVKTLHRAIVSPQEVVNGVTLGDIFKVSIHRGFPSQLNPWYCMVLGRKLVTDATVAHIALTEKLIEISGHVSYLPDVVATGDAVAFPCLVTREQDGIPKTTAEIRPFLFDSTELIVMDCTGIAMGIALVHMLWAIERISLGKIPWDEMIIDAINSGREKDAGWQCGKLPIRSPKTI